MFYFLLLQIGEAEVIKVERRGAIAVHYALGEVTQGSEVNLKVDWERRFDHMQQHTGMGTAYSNMCDSVLRLSV